MSDLRTTWRDFICAPDHPYRHLASLGASVRGAKSDSLDLADLESFLHKLRAEADVILLADMVDLLDGPYLEFIQRDLLAVLDQLSNEMERRDEIVGPGLKGNPRWDRTVLGRATHALRPGLFYSRTAYRSFDLPENALLRWLVGNLVETIHKLQRSSSTSGLHPSLAMVLTRCEEALAHHWFSQLGRPLALTPAMLLAAERHRRPEYRAAAKLARSRARLSENAPDARWYAILMLLAVGWLEPVDDDDLFELYALTLTLDVISQELGFGEPVEYGLVAAGRSHVAAFEAKNGRLTVLFDQSPAVALKGESRYKLVVGSHYGVTGGSRRPDVTVILEDEQGSRRVVILEVKRTASERYISDSIYKMFSYLHDFRSLWLADHPLPRSILLVPEGVQKRSNINFAETAIVSGDDRSSLASALSSALLSN